MKAGGGGKKRNEKRERGVGGWEGGEKKDGMVEKDKGK